MIEIKDVSAGYGNKIINQNISCRFKENTFTAIIGKNGCGKTTLVKSILGLSHIQSGEIIIDGTSQRDLSAGDLAKYIAYLPQNRNTPDITVERMILHGRFPYLSYPRRYSKKDYEMVDNVINKLDIEELRGKLVSKLSGGERQKVYIAMALAQNTKVLILDEPSTYLDITYQLELMRLLDIIKEEGKTIIAVLHDINAALQHADNILIMDSGRIVEYGNPNEIYDSRIIDTIFGIRSAYVTDINNTKQYYFYL